VIDWTIAIASDPRSDLAQTFQMLEQAVDLDLRTPILAAYERASGAAIAEMEFFDVHAALKNLGGTFAFLDRRAAVWRAIARRPQLEERHRALSRAAPRLRRTYERIVRHAGVRVPALERLLDGARVPGAGAGDPVPFCRPWTSTSPR
jgi:hypothetical protein